MDFEQIQIIVVRSRIAVLALAFEPTLTLSSLAPASPGCLSTRKSPIGRTTHLFLWLARLQDVRPRVGQLICERHCLDDTTGV